MTSSLSRRLTIAAAAAALAAMLCTASASAYLTTAGTGTASAGVGSMHAPSNVTTRQTAADVAIGWGAATLSIAGAVDGYRVTRSDGPTVCGSPALVVGLSCTDTDVPAGTYSYTVTAVYRSWTQSSAPSAPAASLVAPTITSKPSSPSADPAPTVRLASAASTYAWGYNGYGQLGNDTTTQSATPVPVSAGAIPAGTAIVQIAAGQYHSLALSSTGRIYAWGANDVGQLGDNTVTDSRVPVAVASGAIPAGTTITRIAAGANHSIALGSNGKLYSWGRNDVGQLGNNTTTNSRVPVAVAAGAIPAGTTITQIVAGTFHSMVLSSVGQVYSWGYNLAGQLGSGGNLPSLVPLAVVAGEIPAGTTITQIAAGQNQSLALGSNGRPYAWGLNVDGQLGNNTTTNARAPVAVPSGAIPAGTTITRMAAGYYHSMVLASTGQMYAWGYNDYGQLGNSTTTPSRVPVAVSAGEIPAGTTITQIGAGTLHSMALGSTGRLYSWGFNGNGQLGTGTTTRSTAPVMASQPPGPTFGAIASGSNSYHVVALMPDSGVTGLACQVDGGAFAPCTGPQALTGLADGSHTFKVHAVRGAEIGPDATYTWTIDSSTPSIAAKPSDVSDDSGASFSFTHARGSYTFTCRLDGGAYDACASPKAYSTLADGYHAFHVKAVDADGVLTPAVSYTWFVMTAEPTQSLVLAPGATNASFDARTLYYRPGVGGSFRFADTAILVSPASATFPAIATVGWTHGAETVTTPSGGPYTSSLFSWTPNPANPTGYVVSAANAAGNTTQAPLTFVSDSTAPAAGALTVAGTVATSGGASSASSDAAFAITARTDFSEALSATQSGLRSSVLTVQSAKLLDTWAGGLHTRACGVLGSGGPFTSPTTITGTAQPAGIVSGACYTYSLTGTDNVGNSATISTTVRVARYIYWINAGDNSIGAANLDTSASARTFMTAAGATGLAVDANYVYWSDLGGNRIGRANLDGSSPNPNFVTNATNPLGLAVDGTHIYWSNRTTPYIGRIDLDGTGHRDPTFISVANDPWGLAVDGGHLYWANHANYGVSSIGRSDLTGAGGTFITGTTGTIAVAVDAGHIYWSNFTSTTIGRANLDGTGIDQSFVTGANTPAGVAVDGGHIYWANEFSFAIGRANLDGSGVPNQRFIETGGSPFALAIGR